MAKWFDYTGSDEQIEALANAETMIRVRYVNGTEANWACVLFKQRSRAIYQLQNAAAYLISEPHPYAELIEIWAWTGCEVYVCEHHNNYCDGILESTDCFYHPATDKPNWNIPNAEYSFTEFKEEV